MEFCEAIQSILLSISPGVTLSYIDDVNLEGEISKVAASVQTILDSFQKTGLKLNAVKCEVTANDLRIIDHYPTFHQFKKVDKMDLTILGAPVMGGTMADSVLKEKTAALERAVNRLSLLPAHDALCLLKNSIAMPKLLYTLRTAPCSGSPELERFDQLLRSSLSTLLNVNLTDDQWKQASLPVHMGGLGVRSACMLASSTFLASAAPTLPLQNSILSPVMSFRPDDRQGTQCLAHFDYCR